MEEAGNEARTERHNGCSYNVHLVLARTERHNGCSYNVHLVHFPTLHMIARGKLGMQRREGRYDPVRPVTVVVLFIILLIPPRHSLT